MAAPEIKLLFPKIHKVVLSGFSLYASQPEISLELANGVFCLAGANGLGKSTFLAALNYGLTGIVSDPRKYVSADEYYRHSLNFTESFFSGRIDDTDRESAEVSLALSVGDYVYDFTRGIFEREALRRLEKYQLTESGSREVLLSGDEMTPGERHFEYSKSITSDIGLGSFDQFVFLQHFVFTFDERRLLLFFEDKIIEQVLYLAFGVDYQTAKRAESLRREKEKADSLVRNANWQATEVRKKIKDIETQAAAVPEVEAVTEDLVARHEKLSEDVEAYELGASRIESQLRDASLELAEASALQVTLRAEYAEEFSRRLRKRSHIVNHPLVASSISESVCALCGAKGDGISKTVQSRVETGKCPLCDSALSKDNIQSKDTSRLREIDDRLGKAKHSLDEAVKTIDRLNAEAAQNQKRLETTRSALGEFERLNDRALEYLKAASRKSEGVASLLDTYRIQMEHFLSKKEEYKARRNEKSVQLRKLQRDLEKQYLAAEEKFVPLFRELAYRFLGIDLDVKLETSSSPSVGLALEVKGTMRRENHQLSESQRFFIDIALRMALAQYMSSPEGRATLFIDTPEGSLDIAYEKHAGDMLATFIANGHHIIMTANVNSSRLIRSLAEDCGKSRMVLHRMTQWAELSEVQIEEETLFEEAYKVIEESLRGDSHRTTKPLNRNK